MATRKLKTRKSGRKTNRYIGSSKRTVRRHRTSVSGKIMPPLDVRSTKHLKDFEKRIKAGPLTIVLVYADWCGHCHTMMPHFDAAAKSPNRSIQAVKVNEQMLSNVNSTINKSINKSAKSLNVEGYPSIIVVDKKGNEVTQMEPVRNTETMTKVMDNAASIATNAGINTNSISPNISANANVKNEIKNIVANKPLANNKEKVKNISANIGVEEVGLAANSSPKNINIGEESLKGSMVSLKNKNKSISLKAMSPEKMADNANINSIEVPSEAISPNTNLNMSVNKSIEETSNEPLVPPSVGSDMEDNASISNNMNAAQKVSGGGRRGGSMYSAMARTAYTLAPAAALLATAAIVIKKPKSRKHKHSKKVRKSLRRRR